MVSAWRRAFCTAIPDDQDTKIAIDKKQLQQTNTSSPCSTPRPFAHFFSTPRSSLRCRTAASSFVDASSSCPSSPISKSSPFSLLKNTLRPSKNNRCGICLHTLKTGQQQQQQQEGVSPIISGSECSHAFHSSCITTTTHVNQKRHGQSVNFFTCPVCNHHPSSSSLPTTPRTPSNLKVYNDDEPLIMSPSSSAIKTFIPIPENDEEAFTPPRVQNFHVQIEETAVISSSRSHETRVATVKIQSFSTATSFRTPVDVVVVANVSERMLAGSSGTGDVVRGMKSLMDCLDSRDRLSIVAFCGCSKRVMNLRRMTTAGRRSARRIIEVIGGGGGTTGVSMTMSVNDAVRKAVKVLDDRKEKNPVSMIFVFSSSNGKLPVGSTLASNPGRPLYSYSCSKISQNIPVHAIGIEDSRACDDNGFAKFISGLLMVVKDVRVQLGFNPGQVAAVYSGHDRPEHLGSDSIKLGDFHSGETKELLMELIVPRGSQSHHVLAVRCSYEDFSSGGSVTCNEKSLLVPKPPAVGSYSSRMERLRCRFICIRAVAESNRLVERKDYSGASRLLTSARALLVQRGLSKDDELLCGLEAELSELNRQKQRQQSCIAAEERSELLTPTSAWRAAERLAKVAKMRRSLNRVSDLHGFENARF